MNDSIYQNIFDKLQTCLPENWEKLVFYAGYATGSYSMKFYTDSGNGVYTDCFSQKGIGKAQLVRVFMEIDKILAAERKKLDAKNRWSVLTMTVDAKGSMKAEFEYTDIGDSMAAYEQEWKKKYL